MILEQLGYTVTPPKKIVTWLFLLTDNTFLFLPQNEFFLVELNELSLTVTFSLFVLPAGFVWERTLLKKKRKDFGNKNFFFYQKKLK